MLVKKCLRKFISWSNLLRNQTRLFTSTMRAPCYTNASEQLIQSLTNSTGFTVNDLEVTNNECVIYCQHCSLDLLSMIVEFTASDRWNYCQRSLDLLPMKARFSSTWTLVFVFADDRSILWGLSRRNAVDIANRLNRSNWC